MTILFYMLGHVKLDSPKSVIEWSSSNISDGTKNWLKNSGNGLAMPLVVSAHLTHSFQLVQII